MDTGDVIFHRPSKTQYLVACVHGDFLHTIGYPEKKLLVESCDLVTQANSTLRRQQIETLAGSTAHTHRPVCARERLAKEQEAEIEQYAGYDC